MALQIALPATAETLSLISFAFSKSFEQPLQNDVCCSVQVRAKE
ncbi:hypothetical protein [Sinorhizobium medicae]|nr:hypothetical protein [Sinorhizobium medicae]UWU12414.1 hypothetical protein N2598_30245 [Sinorhizobium medicae]